MAKDYSLIEAKRLIATGQARSWSNADSLACYQACKVIRDVNAVELRQHVATYRKELAKLN